jgi:hypothetical protein
MDVSLWTGKLLPVVVPLLPKLKQSSMVSMTFGRPMVITTADASAVVSFLSHQTVPGRPEGPLRDNFSGPSYLPLLMGLWFSRYRF